MNAGAALDAARIVFDTSSGRAPTEATRAPQYQERASGLATPRGRGAAMWRAAEQVLQAVVGRAELTGQALVGEARRLQFLTLGDAHALVALQGWVDGLDDATQADAETSPGDTERSVAREAWSALEHAADRPLAAPSSPAAASPRVAPSPPASVSTSSSNAPPPAQPHVPPSNAGWSGDTRGADAWQEATSANRPWYASRMVLFATLLVVLVAGAGGWLLLAGRRDRDFDDGVAAYERGARGVARMAFERAAQQRPGDARPLIFLGRIAREERDVARARRLLEEAVRIDPANAAAQRELAAALLADGQPELARRFYVRAIELDPADRLAQGFLSCALYQLGRIEESRRWYERAGAGAWTACLTAPMPPPMPPPSGIPPQ